MLAIIIRAKRLFLINCILTASPLMAQTPVPPADVEIPAGEVKSLDLVYVYGGNYTLGHLYSEEELIQKISQHPNLERLNISGQQVTPGVMSVIQKLIHLKDIKLSGSIQFHDGDGWVYSWETINLQEITPEMLQGLIQRSSQLERIDLSMSTVDDAGLSVIAQGAVNLSELILRGSDKVTDQGLLALMEKIPSLKFIDISSVSLKQPYNDVEMIGPKISKEVVQQLRDHGITVLDTINWQEINPE